MAKKKQPAKPMSNLRFDFEDSLENVCNRSLMLVQAVDMTLEAVNSELQHATLPESIKTILKERADGLRAALIGEN